MKKFFIFVFYLFLGFTTSINPGTVTIIFNHDFIIDCEFSFIPFCYGARETCDITYFSSNGRWERYYCKIPLPGSVINQQISSATLSVYKIRDSLSSTNTPFQLVINRLSEPMTKYYEDTVGNIPPPEHFSTPIYAISDTLEGNYEGWIDFRLDSLVQGWVNGSYYNAGLLIRMSEEGDTNFYQRIVIGESSYSDSSKRPILKISGPELPDTIIKYVVTSVHSKLNDLENSYYLSQNYPNPFNPSTTIRYQIPKSGYVSLKVYDLLGRELATLVNEEKPVGIHNYQFSIDNFQLPSGVYFYQLRAGSFSDTKKLIIMK